MWQWWRGGGPWAITALRQGVGQQLLVHTVCSVCSVCNGLVPVMELTRVYSCRLLLLWVPSVEESTSGLTCVCGGGRGA
jgi:hypothetical protein